MTGISSLVLRRAALPLDGNIVCRAGRAHLHALGLTPAHLDPTSPMLARATKDAAANKPPRSTAENALKKQLFPSSSPSAPGTQQQPKTITDMFSRQPSASRSNAPARSVETTKPLHNRPLNVPAPLSRGASGKAFASICGSAGSFKEEPDVIDLVDDSPRLPSNRALINNPAPPVYFDEDDFSDDLDLDFQPVSTLPSAPHSQSTVAVKDDDAVPPPASNTSAIPWSQSSPSHFQPPPLVATARQRVSKRSSPDEDDDAAPTTKKSKRQLPWDPGHAARDEVDEVPRNPPVKAPAATPAPKAKAQQLWDPTASAVKAQKKQLKAQQKDSVKVEASIEDMYEAARLHATTKASTAKTSAITLSEEQRHVRSLVVDKGQSVFFTGPAGTGKSVLMRAIISDLKKKHVRNPERVAVTASTGLAACNIGGMTLHSFSGIGLGKEDVSTLVKKIRRNPKAKERWLKTKILVIDEISMVDGELFDKLSQIGCTIRNNGKPWGGIQLVITGDFFQLPPVPDGGKQREAKFAFDAATWNMSIDHTIGLTEVFRQRDPEFAGMLNEMRLGRITDQTVRNFQALSRPLRFDDGLEVTELFPTRQEVDSSNQRRLRALTGKSYRFDAMDTGSPKVDQALRERLLANMMAPPTIELKKGAQVMLIKNMDETLVNGSLGTVEDFMTESTFELKSGDDDAGGSTSDVDSDAKRRVRAFNSALAEAGGKSYSNREYPLVCFHAVDGTQRHILCVPEDWKVELPTGEVQASRKQLPLILAWALSIHKAQGQTLERVKVDLGKVFEKGQAYVALSRATTQQGLQVLNFQKARVMAHPRVVEFYNKLYSAEAALKKKKAGSIASYAVNQAQAAPKTVVGKGGEGSARQPVTVFDDDEEEAMVAFG